MQQTPATHADYSIGSNMVHCTSFRTKSVQLRHACSVADIYRLKSPNYSLPRAPWEVRYSRGCAKNGVTPKLVKHLACPSHILDLEAMCAMRGRA